MIKEMELLSIMRCEDEKRHEMTQIARGKWVPLGHVYRSPFDHPFSEYYQCALCGFEAYTIGTLPPKVCPQCHANNTIYEEKPQR